MRIVKLLGLAAGIAALAACGGATDDEVTNVDDLNMMATDNMALPPVDMNVDMNADMNATTTNGVANDMNMVDNTANTVNGY